MQKTRNHLEVHTHQLISPEVAATNIGTTNIGFSWTSVPDATSYSFVLSPNANLSGALVSQEISTTAFNYAGPLEFGKTYYWQVKAWKGTTLLSTSNVGVFTVGPAPVAPQPPVVVQTTPAPVITIPPAQQITPTWIYAIIGIGAALAVVVITGYATVETAVDAMRLGAYDFLPKPFTPDQLLAAVRELLPTPQSA